MRQKYGLGEFATKKKKAKRRVRKAPARRKKKGRPLKTRQINPTFAYPFRS